jgi:hypothetical protein
MKLFSTAVKRRKSPPEPEPKTPLRPLNAHFSGRLNAIIEGISSVYMAVYDPISNGKRFVSELHDFLSFEIAKVDLEIKQMGWESKIDPIKLAEAKEWKKRIEALKSSYPVDGIDASISFLGELKDDVERTVYGKAQADMVATT